MKTMTETTEKFLAAYEAMLRAEAAVGDARPRVTQGQFAEQMEARGQFWAAAKRLGGELAADCPLEVVRVPCLALQLSSDADSLDDVRETGHARKAR